MINNKPKSRRWGELVITIGVLILPVFFLFRDTQDMLAAQNWASVEGTFTVPSKRGIIAYQYTVEGQLFVNDRLYFFQRLRFGINAESAERNRYRDRIDQPITVYYDPQNPQRSVIFRDDLSIPWSTFCCGGLIYLVIFGRIGWLLLGVLRR